MLVMIFDTETTGLPKSYNLLYSKINEWPYIVQLSYVIYDTLRNKIVKIVDRIIKLPDGIMIPDDSIAIHKITNEMSIKNGSHIKDCLKEFEKDMDKVYVIVGHNLSFDINMIKAECMRQIDLEKQIHNCQEYHLIMKNFEKKFKYCTMQESIDLCCIKRLKKDGKEYNKFPKLSELHEFLFGYIPNNLHNALYDVFICLRCFCKLTYETDIYMNLAEIKKYI